MQSLSTIPLPALSLARCKRSRRGPPQEPDNPAKGRNVGHIRQACDKCKGLKKRCYFDHGEDSCVSCNQSGTTCCTTLIDGRTLRGRQVHAQAQVQVPAAAPAVHLPYNGALAPLPAVPQHVYPLPALPAPLVPTTHHQPSGYVQHNDRQTNYEHRGNENNHRRDYYDGGQAGMGRSYGRGYGAGGSMQGLRPEDAGPSTGYAPRRDNPSMPNPYNMNYGYNNQASYHPYNNSTARSDGSSGSRDGSALPYQTNYSGHSPDGYGGSGSSGMDSSDSDPYAS